jgi:predicted alpha/beta-fold hydrolase
MDLTTPKFYNASDCDSVNEGLQYIHDYYCGRGKRKLFAIGVSLGATILANYMGQTGDKCVVQAAFCTGCHYNYKAFDHLSTNLFGFFDYVLGMVTAQKMKDNFK